MWLISIPSSAEVQNSIYRLLQQKGEFTQADLHLALQWNTAFRKLVSVAYFFCRLQTNAFLQLDNKHVLSEEAGPILQARLVEYVKETKAWTAANIHWAQNKCSSDLSGTHTLFVAGNIDVVSRWLKVVRVT